MLKAAVLNAWSPQLLSVLRIVAAFLYVLHGTQKMFGVPPSASGATVHLASRLGAAATIEIVLGTLILLGLFTRPAAFICSGEMAFAFFLSHFPRGWLPLLNQGELPVLFSFIFLYLAAAGPGPWSLDAAVRRAA
ncbi:MAG TPA: DoxX family protein [Methylomirabilota bacterium]